MFASAFSVFGESLGRAYPRGYIPFGTLQGAGRIRMPIRCPEGVKDGPPGPKIASATNHLALASGHRSLNSRIPARQPCSGPRGASGDPRTIKRTDSSSL